MKASKLKRVKTIWGKLVFVLADELANENIEKLTVCNQFGDEKKLTNTKGIFGYKAPESVYRENLMLG